MIPIEYDENKRMIPHKVTLAKYVIQIDDATQKEITVQPSQFNDVAHIELSKIISKTLLLLTPREERVVRLRFGLGMNGEELTYDAIGELFYLTRERIRQIEIKALRKMKHPANSKWLKQWIGLDKVKIRKNEIKAEIVANNKELLIYERRLKAKHNKMNLFMVRYCRNKYYELQSEYDRV